MRQDIKLIGGPFGGSTLTIHKRGVANAVGLEFEDLHLGYFTYKYRFARRDGDTSIFEWKPDQGQAA